MNPINIPPQGMLTPSGVSEIGRQPQSQPPAKTPDGKSFTDILTDTLAEKNLDITFTAHAKHRLQSREVEMNPDKLQRLDKAIDIAKDKGGHESLILMDGDAYVVNVDKRTVITAVNNLDAKGGVFTQIDSTVII
jgi:flagellar operon protein